MRTVAHTVIGDAACSVPNEQRVGVRARDEASLVFTRGFSPVLLSLILVSLLFLGTTAGIAKDIPSRVLSGVVVTDKNDAVPGAIVIAAGASGKNQATTDAGGNFHLSVPVEPLTLRVVGQYLAFDPIDLQATDPSVGMILRVRYTIPPVHESMVISATALNPTIDQRNDNVYKSSLFSRDDQVFDTLAAGINAGQHEGGGKSLEIRRFGFNLDHGGVNGGLKVLVDDVQQNQSTQGHGQGYLGALKTLTPELVDDVDILNGPFSAAYGDFSGLGVVHIRLKEALPDILTVRMQGGSFGAYRGFVGYSPSLKDADAFIAYEGSHTDGPFINPGRYGRNNVTGNYARHLSEKQSLGFKLNVGTNDFYSSGQIPLDQVSAAKLDRFGFIDPFDGGRVRLGTFGTYYKREMANGDILKVEGFVGRSLFDLYSNFTFFLNDPVNGDEIQQHDSRLQQGVNVQYLHPYKLLERSALLTIGSNFHDNQINVGLLHTKERQVLDVTTSAHAHVTNVAGYAQQGIDLMQGRLHFDGGLRFDYFRFDVDDHLDPTHSGIEGSAIFQPKANASYTPSLRVPVTFFASYGRGISSQDARGVVRQPQAPTVASTDFYQVGTSHVLKTISLSTDIFLIDRSNEQVYIPDDGSLELKGPSRSYGWEAKTSVPITRHLVLNGGFTQVSNAFYRGTSPREYVDSAPHSVANTGLTVSAWRGFNGSLRYRHVSGYILDGRDPNNPLKRASGLDIVDLSMSKQIRHGVDFNCAIDNLNNKRYWETQNYLVSRLPGEDPTGVARIHATPGSPVGVTVGLTFRFGEK
ncbi:MAG: TonB-dependent receptor [Acidobacteria bacterium]|nr:TonB-dependent receptor [Acidobacteriota bacterium]